MKAASGGSVAAGCLLSAAPRCLSNLAMFPLRVCADATSHADATYAHTSEYSCRSKNAAFQSVTCENPNAGAKQPLHAAAICVICSASIIQVILVFPENISLIMLNYR